jgi:hypothetical protein
MLGGSRRCGWLLAADAYRSDANVGASLRQETRQSAPGMSRAHLFRSGQPPGYTQYFDGVGAQREGAGAGTLTRFLEQHKRLARSASTADSRAFRSTGLEKNTFHSADLSFGGNSPDIITTGISASAG